MPIQFHTFDRLYLDRLRAGDSQTEEHFVEYFTRLLQLKLSKRLRYKSAVEDIRQETFSRLWTVLRAKDGIRRPEALGAFVNSTCNNVLHEHFRTVLRESSGGDEAAANMPDGALDAVEAAACRQMRSKVNRVLDELPGKYRELIRKAFLEECDRNELCLDFGVDREYLRVLLHRAKRQFKSLYLKETNPSATKRPGSGFRPSVRKTTVYPPWLFADVRAMSASANYCLHQRKGFTRPAA
jgi:RNA polymerase sigma-70 factor, ECF subfamily